VLLLQLCTSLTTKCFVNLLLTYKIKGTSNLPKADNYQPLIFHAVQENTSRKKLKTAVHKSREPVHQGD